VIECGQSFWRYRSWVPYKYPKTGRNWSGFFRKLKGAKGFAVGPVIVIFREEDEWKRKSSTTTKTP
jgi:hypothetical protein